MLGKRETADEKNPDPLSLPNALKTSKSEKINFLTGIPFSQKYFKILEDRRNLPAFRVKESLFSLLETDDVIILQGETGSGKTTQIPQLLLNSKWSGQKKIIACTQPRRIAAISVAKRVAEETDTMIGEQIGYNIRFDDCTSSKTLLKYITDGMLIRELLIDKLLTNYSIIILDEAHERTLNTDILLPILKDIVARRSQLNQTSQSSKMNVENVPLSQFSCGPLKIIIMSATIQIDRFVNFFDNKVPTLVIPGRTYSVEVYYSKTREEKYVEAAIRTAVQIHVCEPPGDILVFLTGEDEIDKSVNEISKRIAELDSMVTPALVLPLFGSMSIEAQQKIFEQTIGSRKIIISTNIAETSVTIDGVVYVIDCGFAKQKLYHPRYKFESLKIAPISQASAQQRAGRAGRTCPGKAFRLYTEASFENELPPFTAPEIMRNELSGMILNLNMLGFSQLTTFDFVEAPATETILRGLEILQQIDAMSSPDGKLTKTGETLSKFPLEPRLGKVLLTAKEIGVTEECLNIVAVLTSGNWKVRPPEGSDSSNNPHKDFIEDPSCDLMVINNVFKAFAKADNQLQFCTEKMLNFKVLSAAMNVKVQLKQILFSSKLISSGKSLFADFKVSQKVKVAFLSGYFQQIAHLQSSGTYSVLFNPENTVLVHPSSVVKTKPEFLMYIEYILTTKDYMRTVSEISITWLLQMYANMFAPSNMIFLSEFSKNRIEEAKKSQQMKK